MPRPCLAVHRPTRSHAQGCGSVERLRDAPVGVEPVAEAACGLLRPAERGRGHGGSARGGGGGKEIVQPFHALAHVTSLLPEAPQVRGELQGIREPALGLEGVERHAQVAVLCGDPVNPGAPGGAVVLRLGLPREIAIDVSVAGRDERFLPLFAKELTAIGAHRLEQREAVVPGDAAADGDQAPIDECPERVHRVGNSWVDRADRLDLREEGAAREGGETPEEALIGVAEQVVAPGHRAPAASDAGRAGRPGGW